MNKNATAAAVDADDAALTDEAAFAADAEDELRAPDASPDVAGDEGPEDDAAQDDDAPGAPDPMQTAEAGPHDAPDIWRAQAAHLRAAGLASHVIHLSGAAAEDESLALEPLLDLASGALFRLSPGRFAALLEDPDAAAQTVGADVALDAIPDDAVREQGGPTAAALALVAPMAEAALQAGGPRVVIDAGFALAIAARTAEGIADAVQEALGRIESRLARTEAAVDAFAGVSTPDAPDGLEARLAAHIDASVDRAVAAVRADILKSARARRDADRRALEPALDRLDAASGALEEDRRVSAGRSDAYAETIRAIVGELLTRAPAPIGDAS